MCVRPLDIFIYFCTGAVFAGCSSAVYSLKFYIYIAIFPASGAAENESGASDKLFIGRGADSRECSARISIYNRTEESFNEAFVLMISLL